MNKAEKAWDKAIRELGCIVCRTHLGIENPECEVHHLVSGGKREGEMRKIPLCVYHHRGGHDDVVSRHSINGKHGGRKSFEAMYGTEDELLQKCIEYLDWEEAA